MHYNLALIGFGGVNRALAELIVQKKDELKRNYDLSLSIVAVSDMYLGSICDTNGIDLDLLCAIERSQGALQSMPNGSAEANNEYIIKTSNADIIAEATFTDAKTGQPAIDHCQWAFESKKHVVTTNKGPIALGGNALFALAKKHGMQLGFEGSVMSGTPVIRFVNDTLKGCTINAVRGILNGTANYVLGLVEKGSTFDDAIKKAQVLGYAEADPTADVEGWDVLLKVGILANQVMGESVKLEDISREGISLLTESQVREALEKGQRWKLIGEVKKVNNTDVVASVKPQLLSMDDPLAGINGATNAVSFVTDLLGEVMVSGPGAGKIETAYALLADIIDISTQSAVKSSVK